MGIQPEKGVEIEKEIVLLIEFGNSQETFKES